MRPFEPLSYEELPARLKSAIPQEAAPGLRLAAAKGNLPLLTEDLVTCLYYLSRDKDKRVRAAARKSLVELPDSLLVKALSTRISPKILHWFATRELSNPELYVRVLLNPDTTDETFSHLARTQEHPQAIDIISRSESRFIKSPEILEALGQNPHAPVSSIERAAEFYRLQTGRTFKEFLAERESAAREKAETEKPGPTVSEPEAPSGLEETPAEPAPEETGVKPSAGGVLDDELPPDFDISQLLQEDFEADDLFAEDLMLDPEGELETEVRESLSSQINKMTVLNKMRLGLKGNIESRTILLKSPNRLIQECALRNPRITIEEVLRISRDKSQREELIRMISKNRDWTKNYMVISALCLNPKTPLDRASKYLHRLNTQDLASIARSKQVPGMLAVAARKLVMERQRYQ